MVGINIMEAFQITYLVFLFLTLIYFIINGPMEDDSIKAQKREIRKQESLKPRKTYYEERLLEIKIDILKEKKINVNNLTESDINWYFK